MGVWLDVVPLDVMASEASLEHSLLDVIPERSEVRVRVRVRVRVSRERSELRAFAPRSNHMRPQAAYQIALRRCEKLRLAKRPLANLSFSYRANCHPRLEVKFPRKKMFGKKKIFEKFFRKIF